MLERGHGHQVQLGQRGSSLRQRVPDLLAVVFQKCDVAPDRIPHARRRRLLHRAGVQRCHGLQTILAVRFREDPLELRRGTPFPRRVLRLHDGFDASLNRRRTQVDRRSGPVERFAVLWRPGGQDVALADKVFDVCRLFEVERRTRLIRTCCQCPLCEVATLRNGHHGILVAFLDLALLAEALLLESAPTHCNKQSKRDRRCWREAARKTLREICVHNVVHCVKSLDAAHARARGMRSSHPRTFDLAVEALTSLSAASSRPRPRCIFVDVINDVWSRQKGEQRREPAAHQKYPEPSKRGVWVAQLVGNTCDASVRLGVPAPSTRPRSTNP